MNVQAGLGRDDDLAVLQNGILLVIGVAAVRGAVVIGIGPYHLHHLGIGRSLAALQEPESGDVKLDLAVIQSAELLFAEDEEPVRHDGHLLILELEYHRRDVRFQIPGELAAGGDLHGINCVLDAGGLPGVFAGGGEGDFLQGLAGSHGSPGSGEPVPLHLLIILELVYDGWAALDEEGCQRHQAENAHRSSCYGQDR